MHYRLDVIFNCPYKNIYYPLMPLIEIVNKRA